MSSGTEFFPVDSAEGASLVRRYTLLGARQKPQNMLALIFHTVRHQRGQNRGETGVCHQVAPRDRLKTRVNECALPDVSTPQVGKRGEPTGFGHECRRLWALCIRQRRARQPLQQGMTDSALPAPRRCHRLYGTRTGMSRPYRVIPVTPTPIGSGVLTPGKPESDAASH